MQHPPPTDPGGPVIALGMHRSGTSCLIGCLQEAGLELGNVVAETFDNPKGNRENKAIMGLQNGLFRDSGTEWNQPPQEALPWTPERRAERDAIIATYPDDRLWGFKDPRTVFTLAGWLQVLPAARLIGSIRHPLAVAQSLQTRNGFRIERGLKLWLAYNAQLLRICRDRSSGPVGLVSFDWPWPRYDAALRRLCADLGLAAPARFGFVDTALRRNSADTGAEGGADLPAPVADTWQALQQYLV